MHGGVLSTLADVSLCALSWDVQVDAHIVTVSLQVDFVSSAPACQWLIGTGDVVRQTRTLVFVRGVLSSVSNPAEFETNQDVVVSWHGIGCRIASA